MHPREFKADTVTARRASSPPRGVVQTLFRYLLLLFFYSSLFTKLLYYLRSITFDPLPLGYYPDAIPFERVVRDRHRRGVAGGHEVSKAERARILVGCEPFLSTSSCRFYCLSRLEHIRTLLSMTRLTRTRRPTIGSLTRRTALSYFLPWGISFFIL